MARSSMAGLIAHLRSLTSAATDDVYNGVTYWTDDQLQAALDRTRYLVRDIALTEKPYYSAGALNYTEHQFPVAVNWWTEDLYRVHDALGYDVPSADYTVDGKRGIVTFDVNPDRQQYYIDVWLYDMNAAAADVWEQKASHRFDFINMKAGVNHRFDFAQEYQHCVDMARKFRERKIKAFTTRRGGFA